MVAREENIPGSKGKPSKEKTTLKGLGFCSFGQGSNAAAVDYKDNKIVRIRPLYYDSKYRPEEFTFEINIIAI